MSRKKILVTGGAGYIGGFMVKRLAEDGFMVTVVDSMERNSHLKPNPKAKYIKSNLLDEKKLQEIFNSNKFDVIMNFAAFIAMGESMQDPSLYFKNNTFSVLNLLECMRKTGVNKLIFSSSAGVYGNPPIIPIPEDHPSNPTNPYGESKLMVEKILAWYQKIFGINSVSVRYFNAAGAALDGQMGENHQPESHIIPNAINAVLKKQPFTLFGTDYDTPDGTCVRDYIHVEDLVQAHILALNKLDKNQGNFIYNVGSGFGYSNKQVLEMIQKVSGLNLKITRSDRRPGDTDVLIADPSKIKRELGFVPKYSDLETIVKTAWDWHKSRH